MEDLPAELTIDILSRLPVKTIIHCKRVCKKWRNLVLESSFVNLHLSRSPTGFIIHEYHLDDRLMDLGNLKWVEIEDDHQLHHDPPMSLDLNMVPFFQNSLIISQMGSVNGLICLPQYSLEHDNTCICNPVTREIMIIPDPQYYRQDCMLQDYGFGVNSLTGEYKVVRTLNRRIPLNDNISYCVGELEAEVYTLGTGEWRSLGGVPYRLDNSYFGAVLNDHCHWIVSDEEDVPEKICTFDLNKETFQLFPSPPSEAREETDNYFESLAVLKGCLCKSELCHPQLTIWVMKEYGIKKSWHKEVVITKEALNRSREWPYSETVSLIEGLKDGTIFFMSGGLWAFYPRRDTIEQIEMFGWSESGLAYRPSFLKLQKFESERVHLF